jgi:hypothetical protein
MQSQFLQAALQALDADEQREVIFSCCRTHGSVLLKLVIRALALLDTQGLRPLNRTILRDSAPVNRPDGCIAEEPKKDYSRNPVKASFFLHSSPFEAQIITVRQLKMPIL